LNFAALPETTPKGKNLPDQAKICCNGQELPPLKNPEMAEFREIKMAHSLLSI